MKFRNIAAITVGTIIMSTSVFCASTINVSLNGLNITFADAKPTILNGRTMVPLRSVFDKMGYSIAWNATTRTATLTGADKTIQCSEKKLSVTNNNTKQTTTVQSDVLPQILNDRFYLPLRSVASAAECNVDWDANTKTVKISYKTQADSPASSSNSSSSNSSVSSGNSSSKTTGSSSYKSKTEEEKQADYEAYLEPMGDISNTSDTYFKAIFPLLQQLKSNCTNSGNPVFSKFYGLADRDSSSITGTETNFAKVYEYIDKINAISAPADLTSVNASVREYLKLVQSCCQISIDSANGKITPEETAAKVAALATQKQTISYDYSKALYAHFTENSVLWESVYGDYILDLLS